MAKITLPAENGDLKSLSRKKYGFRTVLTIILIAVLIAAYMWYFIANETSLETKLVAAAAFLAVLAAFIWRMKVYELVTDRGWEGTVTESEMIPDEILETDEGKQKWRMLYGQTIPVYKNMGHDERMMISNILHVTVTEDDGRIHKFEINCNGTDFSPYYVKGCRVRHYHGIERAVRVATPDDTQRLCVDCGTLYADGTKVKNCGNCSASIIQK